MRERTSGKLPSSPRKRGSSGLMPVEAKTLDSRLRGNDGQKQRPTPTRLGDVVNFKRGYDLPESARRPGPYPVISSAGISGCHDEYKVRGEGIMTGRYGTLGEMHYYNGGYWPHNTALYVTDFKGNIPKYVYYLLSCLGHLNTGDKSAVPGVNRNDLHELMIPVIAGQAEQKNIATVLSAIDAKIDLNNRINAELEALAKTIYDYWFVQFDFPDAHGRPYKSSGGAMVWNDTLNREIPAGWKAGSLSDAIQLEYGKPMKDSDRSGAGYPVMGSNGVVGYHKDYLIEGPGIVVGRKGTVGAITYSHENFFPIDTTYYVRPRHNYKLDFLLHLLRALPLRNLNSDSAVPGLNRDTALRLPVVLPPDNFVEDFEAITSSFTKRLKASLIENRELTQLRDWLLPLLMNGQLRTA